MEAAADRRSGGHGGAARRLPRAPLQGGRASDRERQARRREHLSGGAEPEARPLCGQAEAPDLSAESSEKLDPDQFQLALEDLEQKIAEVQAEAEKAAPNEVKDKRARDRRQGRPSLPDTLV